MCYWIDNKIDTESKTLRSFYLKKPSQNLDLASQKLLVNTTKSPYKQAYYLSKKISAKLKLNSSRVHFWPSIKKCCVPLSIAYRATVLAYTLWAIRSYISVQTSGVLDVSHVHLDRSFCRVSHEFAKSCPVRLFLWLPSRPDPTMCVCIFLSWLRLQKTLSGAFNLLLFLYILILPTWMLSI